jgi:hypothetical protein
MSCIKSTGPVDLRVVATSTTEIFVPQIDWYPALGVDLVRFGFRLIAESGGLQGRPAYQTATAVIDEAGPGGRAVPQGLGTPVSGPMDALTFALNLGQVQWVRFGSMISLDQAGAPGQGDVLLQATFPACGKPLGRFVQQVHIGGNNAAAVVPITSYVPALSLLLIRSAIVVTGVSGALQTRLMIQTADVSSATPNEWQPLGQPASGARKDCVEYDVTGFMDPSTGTKPLLARFGLAYNLASGSNEAYASVGIDTTGRLG